jgi:hypothetical protein
MDLVNAARLETIAMGENPGSDVMVQMDYAAEDWKVNYELRDGTQVTGAEIMKKPVVTQSRKRPYAYILPRDARDAVAMLRRHNITVEVLQRPIEIEIEAYTLEDVDYLQEYNHAAAVRVKVGEVVTRTQRFPAGSFVVSTAQMLGRVVVHMLEPETNDNVVRWNTMDAWLPKTRISSAADAAAPRGQAATRGAGGQRGAGRAAGRGAGAQRGADAGERRGAGGQRGAGGGGRGGRGGQGAEAVIPIYKVMTPTPMPTRILGS